MRKKYSYYYYKTYQDIDCPSHWIYCIYDNTYPEIILRESDEWYETEVEADFAAIGHISLLENGEG